MLTRTLRFWLTDQSRVLDCEDLKQEQKFVINFCVRNKMSPLDTLSRKVTGGYKKPSKIHINAPKRLKYGLK